MNQRYITRREFIKKSAGYATCAAIGLVDSAIFQETAAAKQQEDVIGVNDLLQAIEDSDVSGATELLKRKLAMGADAWQIHLSLFPVVQRTLNPPYVDPHRPKVHAICRELAPYLKEDEIAALLHIEVSEYARRPKLELLPKAKLPTSPVSFNDIESAIREQDWEKTTITMATFNAQKGSAELMRQLLLLGSGYLYRSLGHSISCTAFILLEMLQRADQDPWPALSRLSNYFCKEKYNTSPDLGRSAAYMPDENLDHQLMRATSGTGIVNIHHTITFYALERVRHFFDNKEYQYLIGAWIAYMKDKKAEQIELESREIKPPADYGRFYKTFSRLEPESVAASAAGMMNSPRSRRRLGHFLIKGMCDQYQGDYNAHNLTGLASALWVLDRFGNHTPIAINALYQYLDFFFNDLKSKR